MLGSFKAERIGMLIGFVAEQSSTSVFKLILLGRPNQSGVIHGGGNGDAAE